MFVVSEANNLQSISNPLAFWKTHRNLFPVLHDLACAVYGMLPASAEAERMFSVLNNTLTPQRRLLKKENFIRAAFVKLNADLVDVK